MCHNNRIAMELLFLNTWEHAGGDIKKISQKKINDNLYWLL